MGATKPLFRADALGLFVSDFCIVSFSEKREDSHLRVDTCECENNGREAVLITMNNNANGLAIALIFLLGIFILGGVIYWGVTSLNAALIFFGILGLCGWFFAGKYMLAEN
jgi:hypothetical protein